MNFSHLPLLPLGTTDFRTLRMRGQIYVDKTDLIYQLAVQPQKFFLARPRRFGKSLLISTFEHLFKYGTSDFKGLKIESLWNDKTSYNVVSLNFARARPNKTEPYAETLNNYLLKAFSRLGFKRQNKELNFLNELENFLAAQPNNSLVLLIDEYDYPLTAAIEDKLDVNEVRQYLAEFYQLVKAQDAALRFVFITGVTKFNKVSIFSGLNFLTDISLSPRYGSLLGYTHEEVETYFPQYLELAQKKLGLNREEFFSELVRNYNGFCFDELASVKVFAPWSLLSFLAEPVVGFKNYWFETGGQLSLLKSRILKDPAEYGKDHVVSVTKLSGAADIESISDVCLLTQTGYLTIKARVGNDVIVNYPNLEVRNSMAERYTENIFTGLACSAVYSPSIREQLLNDQPETIFHFLQKLFCSLDYKDFPVNDEASVRALVQIIFSVNGFECYPELHNHVGRSDLEVKAGHRRFIFEFKVVRTNENSVKKLEEGILQVQKYGTQHNDSEIIRMVLVFSTEKKEFVKWAAVPQSDIS